MQLSRVGTEHTPQQAQLSGAGKERTSPSSATPPSTKLRSSVYAKCCSAGGSDGHASLCGSARAADNKTPQSSGARPAEHKHQVWQAQLSGAGKERTSPSSATPPSTKSRSSVSTMRCCAGVSDGHASLSGSARAVDDQEPQLPGARLAEQGHEVWQMQLSRVGTEHTSQQAQLSREGKERTSPSSATPPSTKSRSSVSTMRCCAGVSDGHASLSRRAWKPS